MSAAPSGRKVPFARFVAGVVILLYVAGTSATAWFEGRLGPRAQNPMEDVFIVVGFGMFAVMGALLVALRPYNLVGWIMSAVGLIVGVFPTGEAYAAYVMITSGQPDALAVFGVWANGWYWYLLLSLSFVFLPLYFPDGRLPSRRWLPVAVLAGIATAALVVLGALTDTLRGQSVPYRIENPVGIEGLAPVEELPVFAVFGGLLLLVTLCAAASVVVRFRRSRGIKRQQLKWFLYAAAFIPVSAGSDFLPRLLDDLVFGLILVGLPLAIGFAVLKHRLYDIDVVINRTLVYGTLTAMLALVYFGGVAGLQRLLSPVVGEGNGPAVVASTLLIAALFQPLRRRVQGFIDRRFYRKKYDAAQTLEAFSNRLRDETDLGKLDEDLLATVRETVQPAHVLLWLREPGRRREPGFTPTAPGGSPQTRGGRT